MNKKEFIDALAERNGITKVAATELYDTVFDMLQELLEAGNEVSIPSIGKFKVVQHEARMAHNPKTMEEVVVPEKKVVKFTVAKCIKDAVALL